MMQKIIRTYYSLLITAFLLTSCGEESNVEPQTGPDILLTTEGFLCTTGPSNLAALDTLYYHYNAGAEELRIYDPEHVDDKQQIHLTATGDNTIRIEMKIPYINGLGAQLKYLGINKAVNPPVTGFPNHPYQFKLYEDPDPETHFVITRGADNIHQFTIESNLYKGHYLTTGKWKGDLGTDHPNVVFETGKKYWFFK